MSNRGIRRYSDIEVQELGENGEVINTYTSLYDVKNTLKNPRSYTAGNIIYNIRRGWKIQGRRFRLVGQIGDFEITSNNLPDCT